MLTAGDGSGAPEVAPATDGGWAAAREAGTLAATVDFLATVSALVALAERLSGGETRLQTNNPTAKQMNKQTPRRPALEE